MTPNRGRIWLTCLIVCFLASSVFTPAADATLSKSDKKTKKPKTTSSTGSDPSSSHWSSKSAGKPEWRDTAGAGLTYTDIVLNYDRVHYTDEKKFPNAVLGYVTPWNNHGYDVGKWLAHKFTHISPVWFQVVPNPDTSVDALPCSIQGTHDLDQGWVRDVRSNNSAVKIVPRFVFEKWGPNEYRMLFTDELEQERCAHVVVDFLQRNKFEGAVIEQWVSVMTLSQGSAAMDLVHFVRNWAEIFQSKNLLFIMPVPPSLDAQYRQTGYFTVDHFDSLADSVHLFNVMTYDHPARDIGPIAPIEWVEANINYLLRKRPDAARKLLMGLNFYGHENMAKSPQLQPLIGNRFIEILRTRKPEIHWSKSAAEHYLSMKDHTVYFPSLSSVDVRLKMAKMYSVGVGIWELGQGLDYFYNLF